MKLLTAIIHFQTPDLLSDAVTSFRDAYADAGLWIVDNGSAEEDRRRAEAVAAESGSATRFVPLATNQYHGPGMHHVLQESDADAVFFLDSDTVTKKPGFLEGASQILRDSPNAWVAGQAVRVDARGFAAPDGLAVPESAYMMVRRAAYLALPPFRHHGLPVLETSRAAEQRGLRVADYPMRDYIDHLGRGTAARFGYGLGLRSRLDYLLHRLGW